MNKKKVLSAGIIGNIVEYYDFGMYAVFAEIIATNFFAHTDRYTQLMYTFAVFAIGIFMRPVGGILFGHIGDKKGRKTALNISIIGMAISTMLIGVLPGYSQIGVFAPITLTIIRIFQGICIGGEGTGSAVFVIEHFAKKRIGLIGSIAMASNVAGTFLAILVGITINHFIGINNFTWRYGFLFGSVMGILGFFLRRNITETPEFKRMKRRQKTFQVPIKAIILQHPKTILILASFASMATSSTYIIRGFFNTYFTEILAFPKGTTLYIVMYSLISLILFLPIFGFLADKIGYKKYIFIPVILLIGISYPTFETIVSNVDNICVIIICVMIFGASAASVASPYYSFAVNFFSPELRYSGVSLGWNLGNAIFGGTSPLISTFLAKNFGYTAPSYYIIFTGSLFIISQYFLKKTLDITP